MLAVYLAIILFKHPWGWGGDLDMDPASCKWPLAGRSTHPHWILLPETGKSCLFLLPSCQHKCFHCLCSPAMGGARTLFSVLLGFPTNHCVLNYSSLLPCLQCMEQPFRVFLLLFWVSLPSPPSPLPPPRLDVGSVLSSLPVYWGGMLGEVLQKWGQALF